MCVFVRILVFKCVHAPVSMCACVCSVHCIIMYTCVFLRMYVYGTCVFFTCKCTQVVFVSVCVKVFLCCTFCVSVLVYAHTWTRVCLCVTEDITTIDRVKVGR